MSVRKSGPLKAQFTTIAAYDMKQGDDPALVNFEAVLSSLAGGQKNGFALPDIAGVIEHPEDYQTAEDKAALQFLAGNHPSRMTLSLVKAAGPDGKPVVMPVVTDRLYDRVMVLGPVPLPAKTTDGLSKSGLLYLNSRDKGARSDISEFFVASMRERADKASFKNPKPYDMTAQGAQEFVKNFTIALTIAADYSKAGLLDASGKIGDDVIIADMLLAIPQGKTDVAAYTAAAKRTPQLKR